MLYFCPSLQNPLVFLAVSVATVAAVPSGGIIYSSPLTYGSHGLAAVSPTKTALATVNTVSE